MPSISSVVVDDAVPSVASLLLSVLASISSVVVDEAVPSVVSPILSVLPSISEAVDRYVVVVSVVAMLVDVVAVTEL